MATPCYYLNVTIRSYDAEVFLNGAPIVRAFREFPRVALLPVSEWLVQGENRLSVTILGADHLPAPVASEEHEGAEQRVPSEAGPPTEPPRPPTEGEDAAPPLLRVALCVGDLGELVEPGRERELLVLEWTPPPPPGEGEPPLSFPLEAQETLTLSHPWGIWSWEQAPRFDFEEDPTIVLDVTDFVAELHAAMAQGQLATVIGRSVPKYDEVAPCYDMDPADARERLVLAWLEISAPPGFRLADFDPADVDLRLCCDARVIEPRTLTGEPILRQALPIDDTSWEMPLYIARIDGQLTVVR